jgi:peptidoglycan/xylan/chitin deacetylase (PgdA/CDA1 family)
VLNAIRSNASLWDLYAKVEEYNPQHLDEHDRFLYKYSNQNNILEPTVSEFLVQQGMNIDYPDNYEFGICLTHDVDTVFLSKKRALYEAARRGIRFRIKQATKMLMGGVSKHYNPRWNFNQIMDLEDSFGAKSTFFFMALKPREPAYNYRLDLLQHELDTIIEKGWEVGLHGGYYAYNDLERITTQRDRLEAISGKTAKGYRNHFLRFAVPTTWELLTTANFSYDATFGYSETFGFRNGMCHPFRPYNITTDTPIKIIEIPLMLMDVSLIRMQIPPNQAWPKLRSLLDSVRKNKGTVSILWHNNRMDGDWLKLYTKILQYGKEKHAWMTTGEELSQWWEKRVI